MWYRRLDMNGKVIEETQPGLNPGGYVSIPFLFQGQYYDYETGLAYNRFRYYDPELGRYISEDPIRLEGGIAMYAYVEDVNAWVDMLGLSCSASQRKKNRINGEKAEQLTLRKLQRNPSVEVLGMKVTIETPHGIRYVDILIKNRLSGKIIAVEVKSGNAKRSTMQIKKDKAIDQGLGKFKQNGFFDEYNNLIGRTTSNTVTSVTHVPLWKL